VKVYFETRKIAKVLMAHVQDFFRKRLLKENFLVWHSLLANRFSRKNVFKMTCFVLMACCD